MRGLPCEKTCVAWNGRFYPNYTKPYRQCTHCEKYFGRDDDDNRILLDIRDPHISKSSGKIRECNTDGPILGYPKERYIVCMTCNVKGLRPPVLPCHESLHKKIIFFPTKKKYFSSSPKKNIFLLHQKKYFSSSPKKNIFLLHQKKIFFSTKKKYIFLHQKKIFFFSTKKKYFSSPPKKNIFLLHQKKIFFFSTKKKYFSLPKKISLPKFFFIDMAFHTFCAFIDEKLSPTLVGGDTPLPEVPSTICDITLLHALNVSGQPKLSPRPYKLHALWLMTDDMYSEIPSQPSCTINLDGMVHLNATKDGNLAVTTQHTVIFYPTSNESLHMTSIISVVDGSVISQFEHSGDRVTVDPEGRLWIGCRLKQKICCYTENGRLLHTIQLQQIPAVHSIAYLKDDRIVICSGRNNDYDDYKSFVIYSIRDRCIKIINTDDHVYKVKVCGATNKIFAVKRNTISIYSSDGVFLRDMNLDLIYISFDLTSNGRMYICYRYSSSYICDIANYTLIAKSPHCGYDIVVLPYGKIAIAFFQHREEGTSTQIKIF